MKLLVTTDGSPTSLDAVRYVAKTAPSWSAPEIHLLNVQPPVAGAALVGAAAVRSFHKEEGEKALAPAKALLDGAGIRYEAHCVVGEIAEAIAAYARDRGVDQIVMSTQGKGAIETLFLGSTTTKVLQLATVPVTLVK
jgi:nucleotide-binding universal stress UspA family protein